MTSPIFTALFAYLLLGERLHALHAVAIAGSFCGVILVLSPSPDQPIDRIAAAVALAGSAIAALAFVTTRCLADESAAVLLQYMGGAGAALAGAASLLAEAPVLPDAVQASLIGAVCIAGLIAQVPAAILLCGFPEKSECGIYFIQVRDKLVGNSEGAGPDVGNSLSSTSSASVQLESALYLKRHTFILDSVTVGRAARRADRLQRGPAARQGGPRLGPPVHPGPPPRRR